MIDSCKADVSSFSPSSEQLTRGQRSKRQPLNSLRWPIYVFNSVDDIKLPRYTLPPTHHPSFFRNLPPSWLTANQLWRQMIVSVARVLVRNVFTQRRCEFYMVITLKWAWVALLVIPLREAPSFMSQSRILIERVSSIDRFRRECRQVTFQVAKERISIAVKYLCT